MKESERKLLIEKQREEALARADLLKELQMVEGLLDGEMVGVTAAFETVGQIERRISVTMNSFSGTGPVFEMRRENFALPLLNVLRSYRSDLCLALGIDEDAEPDENMGPIKVILVEDDAS